MADERDTEVEYYEDDAGEWRWRLVAANGEVVAQGEGHRDRTDAERAFEAVLRIADEAAPSPGEDVYPGDD